MLQTLLDLFFSLLAQLFAPLIGPFTRALSVRRQDDGGYRGAGPSASGSSAVGRN